MKRQTLAVLAGVLFIQSVIVALVFTPQPHPGGDNAGYVALAHSLLDQGAYLELWSPGEPPHTKYPPVFPALLAFSVLLGAKSWAALKLVPAFSTVLAVAFAFLWARSREGFALAAVTALLFGLSESVVYYSQWILSDPTFLALTFAALWALQGRLGSPDAQGGEGEKARRRGESRWLALGMVLVVLAYATRSAGLPLALATLLWLGIQRRWKALGAFLVVFGLPAFLWWLRGKVLGGSGYVSEFWLIDPYQPHLGTVGLGELVERLRYNLAAYVTSIIPGGIVGEGWPILPPLGIGLALFGLVGWIRVLVKRIGPAEIFFPLYFGLILLWPQAWSGDRFALPLLPLTFFYSGVALLWLLSPFPVMARRGVVVVLTLLLLVPAGTQWRQMARGAGACRQETEVGNAWGCFSPAQGEYFSLAQWSGENLPKGAVVTTRKPRTFFVMSGIKARSIPFVQEPDEFLRQVREAGSRYVSLDLLDRISGYYVLPVLSQRLDRFCGLVEVGALGQGGTQLLGIVEAGTEPGQGADSQALPRCPEGMVRNDPGDTPGPGWDIPLLVGEKVVEQVPAGS